MCIVGRFLNKKHSKWQTEKKEEINRLSFNLMFVSAHVSDALENESKDTENHYQSTFDYIIYA